MTSGINHLWQVASSGIHARRRQLDIISHNVANSSTVGFKASRGGFQALIRERVLNEDEAALYIDAQPGDVVQDGMGTLLTASTRHYAQGVLKQTHNPYNMAINGEGFFQVADTDGTLLYTRSGDFQLDADGRFTNSSGHLLQPAVALPEDVTQIYIDGDGRILGLVGDEPEPQELGVVELATFVNPDGLAAVGESAFAVTDASGPAQLGQPGIGRGTLVGGFVEESNVDLGQEMTRLLQSQRAYSLSLRALRTADEIYRMANEMPQ